MRKYLPYGLVIATAALSALVYSRLPNPMPIHWNWRGVADGWAPTAVGAWLMPVFMLLLIGLFYLLPRFDSRRANYERFWPEYQLMIVAVTGMLASMHVAMLAIALGYQVPIMKFAMIMVGVLFIVLGNIMPRIRPNHIAGFRTKATLSNDVVWSRTHRAGGAAMMIAGIVILLGSLAPAAWAIPIIAVSVLAMTVAIARYSSRVVKELSRSPSPDAEAH